MVAQTGHGRGKNAQYSYQPPEGYEVALEPTQAESVDTVNEVRQIRKEEAKGRYDAYKERMFEDGVDIEADKGVQKPAEETLAVEPSQKSTKVKKSRNMSSPFQEYW